jgi:hypothetical protein
MAVALLSANSGYIDSMVKAYIKLLILLCEPGSNTQEAIIIFIALQQK